MLVITNTVTEADEAKYVERETLEKQIAIVIKSFSNAELGCVLFRLKRIGEAK